MSLVNDKLFDVNDIKPKEINEFIDNQHNLFNGKTILRDKCPACGCDEYHFAFDKYTFHYVQCAKCMSLYVQNVISQIDFKIYTQNIEQTVYSTVKYQEYLEQLATESSFALEILFSRFLAKGDNSTVAYMGVKESVFQSSINRFDIKIKAFDFNQGKSEKKFDLIIIDHVLEKSLHVKNLMNNVYDSLNNGGYVYILSRVGSGIDILTLWEESKIFPIEHQNLLSIEGFKRLLSLVSFTIKELNTPGTLDIDNILKKNSKKIPRFIGYLKMFENEKALEDFRVFLQKNLLSSFATIIAQKDLNG